MDHRALEEVARRHVTRKLLLVTADFEPLGGYSRQDAALRDVPEYLARVNAFVKARSAPGS